MEEAVQLAVRQEVNVRKPDMYAVVMYNDEVTTMDFVVEVLIKVFGKPAQVAAQIMMDIHESGQGIAGVYIYDIAITKKSEADRMSMQKSFPLKLQVQSVGNEA
jgi:ATP-dependent Clp protease adaptor protein ClpS